MTFGQNDYRNAEQTRRLRNRSILLFIILATVPCYVVGGIMLGVAPDDETVIEDNTVPPPNQSTDVLATATGTSSPEPTVTSVLDASREPTTTLIATPRQFVPPTSTRFPTRIIPTSTLAPTFTLPATATQGATATNNPAVTATATASATQTLVPTATEQANRAPVLNAPLPDVTLSPGEIRQIAVDAADPDGDMVSITASSDNASVVSIESFGETNFTIRAVAAGSATITVTLLDPSNADTTASFGVAVAQANRDPVFSQEPGALTLDTGASTTLNLGFSDPDGDTVTSQFSVADSAVATVAKTSETQYTVTGLSGGTTTASIQLSDGNGGVAQRAFTITVNAVQQNRAPNISAIEPSSLSITNGDSSVVFVTATDPDGDNLTLSVASAAPGIASANTVDAQSFTVQAQSVGSTTITVTVSDGQLTAQGTVSVTVTAPNAPPSFSQQPPQNITLAMGASRQVELFYEDPNGDAVTLSIAASTPNVVSLQKASERLFTVTGTNASSTQVTVRLVDGRGGELTHIINVTVTS